MVLLPALFLYTYVKSSAQQRKCNSIMWEKNVRETNKLTLFLKSPVKQNFTTVKVLVSYFHLPGF